MEGFDGLGGYEAPSTKTVRFNNLVAPYKANYDRLERMGFRPYDVPFKNEMRKMVRDDAVCQEIDTMLGCSSSEEDEKAAKQCCSCWKYTDFFKEIVWCRGCYDLTGEMESTCLCMDCVRLCGKVDAFVMKVCGQCAV